MEDHLHLSTGQDDPEGSPQTTDFQRIGSASSPVLAQSTLVSESVSDVQISEQISISETYAEGSAEDSHRRFLSYLGPSRMDFLRKCLRKDFGRHVTSYLLRDLRESSARQYETAWTYLLRNVRLRKLISFSEKNIIEFFIWLIEKGSLQANTIASYKCALDRLLRLGLTSLNSGIFSELSEACFHIQPPPY